ncbi:inositol monophosphatase 2-like [Octopus sinensis]|uniref:Inositol monophosphatase 2-like n=1 Tax=Octopus sinensis TaxID=2607531 RepID=A0A6P7TZG9_9MOLL|nr:inositol monophosphatase 2-like [Octopus sinensis]
MLEAIQTGLKVEFKSSYCDLVTETDRAIENKIKTLIYQNQKFKDHRSLSVPILDLLAKRPSPNVGDSETNSRGLSTRLTEPPTCSQFSQFLCLDCSDIPEEGEFWTNGSACRGVVFNPSTKEMFSAITGRGAFKNGQQMRVSSVSGNK